MHRDSWGLLLLALLASGCAVQPLPDEPGWESVQEPTAPHSTSAAPAAPQSLGSHFLIDAQSAASQQSAADPSLPVVARSSIRLSSDGCDVTLQSLAIEVLPVNSERSATRQPLRLSSAGSVVGRVLHATPDSLHVAFDATMIEAPSAASGSGTETPAAVRITIDAVEAADGVATSVQLELGEGSVAVVAGGSDLSFAAFGTFCADASAVPAQRWECW